MRPFLSLLLIAIVACHWTGSYIGFKVMYTVEVEPEMNAIEQVIADVVKSENNLDAHITIVPADQLEMRGNGYGNVFVFSTEINGETIFYKIDPAPNKFVTHEYVSNAMPDSDQQQKVALFEQLFSKYTVPQTAMKVSSMEMLPSKANFRNLSFQQLLITQVPTPPPDLLATV